jgi:hypothetical protein
MDPDPEKILQDSNPDDFEEAKKVYKNASEKSSLKILSFFFPVRYRIWNKIIQNYNHK